MRALHIAKVNHPEMDLEMSVILTAKNWARNRKNVDPAPGLVRLLAPHRRILCNPHVLREPMLLSRIFAQNGYRAVSDFRAYHECSVALWSRTSPFVVNARHVDNTKRLVARQWKEASGRNVEVNPTVYTGRMVEKSDRNATHDGRVLDGPIAADEVKQDRVYQVLIDNTDGEHVLDLRVTFHGDRIPLVYLKRRPTSTRFSNENSSVEIAETGSLFSVEEQRTLLRFARNAGLDYGEADVLRDKTTGEIWVVDSTESPAGPPNGLKPAGAREAVRRLSAAFDQMLEEARA